MEFEIINNGKYFLNWYFYLCKGAPTFGSNIHSFYFIKYLCKPSMSCVGEKHLKQLYIGLSCYVVLMTGADCLDGEV